MITSEHAWAITQVSEDRDLSWRYTWSIKHPLGVNVNFVGSWGTQNGFSEMSKIYVRTRCCWAGYELGKKTEGKHLYACKKCKQTENFPTSIRRFVEPASGVNMVELWFSPYTDILTASLAANDLISLCRELVITN